MPITNIRGQQILNGTVQYVDIQQVAALRLVGNPTGSAATMSEISLGTGLSFSGSSLVLSANLQSLSGLSYSSASFVKMTAAGTFALDTATYEPTITAGTTSQYWRGDKSWQTLNTTAVAEGTNLYYTDARARAALSFAAGSGAYNSSTGVITIPTNTNQLTNGAGFITGNQTITLSGDVSGSGTTTISTTLATITQSTGANFVKITLDTKGRVTGNTAVGSGDITTALGYTPYNSTNPNGYTSNTGTVTSVSGTGTVSGLTLTGTVTGSGSLTLGGTLSLTSGDITTGLGYTPYNSTNPNSYISATQTYYIGTTQNALNRSSAAQTLTGVSIDGNAATVTGFKNIGNVEVQAVSGTNQTCTTAQFLTWYETNYSFKSYYYTVAKCTWYYAGNNNITDTSIGSCEMAGSVIETFSDGTYYTIRITRPTTGDGGFVTLVYNDQGSGYSPGWRTDWNSSNLTNLNQLTNGPGYLTAEADTLGSVTGRNGVTSNSVQLTSSNNYYSGHHYFIAYDANGNHYPHYNVGSNNNGSKLNLRMYGGNGSTLRLFYLDGNTGGFTWDGNTVWHSGNDGSGSGLDADLLDGAHASVANNANYIVTRDGSGDIFFRYSFSSYVNTTDDVSSGTITNIIAKFGDNYHRSASAASVQTFLGLGSMAYASTGSYLPLVGGTMSGNINWDSTEKGITWAFNTDGAHIKFYNTGNGDTDSRLEYATFDDGNEYHKFVISGNERFSIKADGARVSNNIVLHAANYNSYAPTLTGGSASGTWGINVTGNAATANRLTSVSISNVNTGRTAGYLEYYDVENATGQPESGWNSYISVRHGNPDNQYGFQFASPFGTDTLYWRGWDGSNPRGWRTVWHSGNLNVANWFGAVTTGGTTNWNDVTNTRPGTGYTLLLGTHSNGPGPGDYFHAFNLEYSSKDGTGNVTQMAIPYSSPANKLYMRGRYDGSWSGWTQFVTNSGTWGINVTGTAGSETLATVMSRGATSSTYISLSGGGVFNSQIYSFRNALGDGVYLGSTTAVRLQAYSDDGGAAYMTFHRSNSWAVNMGLDPDNVFRIGGYSASANRLQLDMSGNFYVAGSMYPGTHVYFANDSSPYTGTIRFGDNTGWIFRMQTSVSGTYTTRFSFTDGGTFTAVGDVIAYSDARVKTNVATITDPLDKVTRMRGVTYNRTDGTDASEKVGVIAQEIQEVLPQVVTKDKEGMLGVSYGNLAGVFIEAIKEQQKQIEDLKKQIEYLVENK